MVNTMRRKAVPLRGMRARGLFCELVKNALLRRSKAPEQQLRTRLKIAEI
jgi:hypothetical protein